MPLADEDRPSWGVGGDRFAVCGMRAGRSGVDYCMDAIRELRLVLTVGDFDAAAAFYRDALGLEQLEAWQADAGRVAILAAGRATIELIDETQAATIDRIEVGQGIAGPVRLALEVADSAATERLTANGAEHLAGPVETPWRHRNVRLRAPDGTQLTLFAVLD